MVFTCCWFAKWFVYNFCNRWNLSKKSELSIPITIDFRSVSSILEVEVTGENQVRRGTTHFIEINVHRDECPVTTARVSITIENYGEDIIR